MSFNEDIVITDPCYFRKSWDTNFNSRKLPEGFTNFVTNNTVYGDWKCTVYEVEERFPKISDFLDYVRKQIESEEPLKLKELGTFTADGGEVSVVYYKELLNYNPEFFDKPKSCYTVIKDFCGDTGIADITVENNIKRVVYGYGNKQFFSVQTGF